MSQKNLRSSVELLTDPSIAILKYFYFYLNVLARLGWKDPISRQGSVPGQSENIQLEVRISYQLAAVPQPTEKILEK